MGTLGLAIACSMAAQATNARPIVPLPWWSFLLAPGIYAFAVLAEIFRFGKSVRRTRFFTRLEYEKRQICPDCHGALQASPDRSVCPGCAYTYTGESLDADWADVEKLLRLGGPEAMRRERAIIRRRMIEPFAGYYLYGFVLAGTLASALPLVSPRLGGILTWENSIWLIWGIVLLAFGGAWALFALRCERFFSRLEAQKYLICPDCHYSLAGHQEGGHCPECGYQFTPESLIADWADVRNSILTTT
jgi:ribosomal protein S27AE